MKPAGSDLQQVPGVGPRIAGYLQSIGIRRASDLEGKDPERLFRRLCRKHSRPLRPPPDHPAEEPYPVEGGQTGVAADRLDEPAQGREEPGQPRWNSIRPLRREAVRTSDARLTAGFHFHGPGPPSHSR
jgi:hypothetical protein